MKRYLTYIIFNTIAIAATVILIVLGRERPPYWSLWPEIILVALIVGVNFVLIYRGPRDYRYDLAKTCEGSAFAEPLHKIEKAYEEILAKEKFFAEKSQDGSISEAYSLIKKQLESNITSAIEVTLQHPKGKPAESSYMEELVGYSEQLVEKQSQLVEQAIRLQSIKDDVDISFVTEYIKAMEAVLGSDDLTYDAFADKYATMMDEAAFASPSADAVEAKAEVESGQEDDDA